ncbi:MAG: hypothetical protein ACFFGZ_19290, partial [Candidatus Thorarchaeota archaeon]
MKRSLVFFFSIIMALIFLGSSVGTAIRPQADELEYVAAVGDSKDYEMLKYYTTEPEGNPKRFFSYTEFTKADGSNVSITVTKGTEFSVEVTAINESLVYGQITLEGHILAERIITIPYLSLATDVRFVMETTNNLTHWEQEVTDRTDESDSNDWTKAWLDGNIFYLEDYAKHADNSIDHDKRGINYKTGWMEYYYDKATLSDGSVIYEMEWKEVDLEIPTSGDEDSPGFEVVPFFIA